ncbi:MAG TPA: hypothetical protein VLM37_08245 [Fibrobacteraceae bacterium]|nr:hypothetical protein [Fibrobacteraceae bacterium]
MRRIFVVVLTVVVVAFAAGKRVKSKMGNLDLMKAKGGTDAVCTADFSDEMTVLKKDGQYALVKLAKDNCQGWVEDQAVEYVAAAAGDKSMKLEGVDVVGWLDNPAAVFVLENDAADFGGVDINRDFREYLQHTEDREKLETKNQEN